MAIITSKNTLPVTSGVALFNLKTFLVSAGWTVLESGDGLSAYGLSPGTLPADVITSGGSGANGMANAKAWFRVRRPGSVNPDIREFIFQWVSATQIRIKYSPNGFTGGGGSATQCSAPAVAANQAIVLGGGTDAAPTGSDLFGTLNRVSYFADTASPYGWGAFGWSTAGVTTFGMVYEAIFTDSCPASEAEPYLVLCYPAGGGAVTGDKFGVFLTGMGLSATCNFGWFAYGLGGQTWTTFAGYSICMSTGTGPLTNTAGIYSVLDPWAGKDVNIPYLWARAASLTTQTGWKGAGKYGLCCLAIHPNLTMQSVATANDRIILGNTSFPWGTDGVAPLL